MFAAYAFIVLTVLIFIYGLGSTFSSNFWFIAALWVLCMFGFNGKELGSAIRSTVECFLEVRENVETEFEEHR